MKDKSLRILIIEDSENDALLIIRNLKKGGYNPVYERVETDAAMKKTLEEKQWDIILCDYKMPKFNAPSAIAILKEANIDIPIIVVTGKIGEETAVDCMHLGAHDYIMKDNLSRLCPAIARELEDAEVRNKQKHTEEKLRHEGQRFMALVEHSSDIIVVLDTEATVTYVNPALEQVLGFKPEERIGKKGFELVHPDDINLLAEYFITLISDTNSPIIHWEMRLRHKNGSWRTLEAVGSNLVNNNVVEAMVVNYRDITERKRVEETLRESEDKYKSLINNVPDIIFTIDLKGKITFVSKRAKEISGYENDEVINKNIFNFIPEEYHQKTMENLQKGMKGEKIKHIEMPVTTKSGEKLFFDFSFSRIYKDGAVVGAQGTAVDITERKGAEAALLESEIKYRTLFESASDAIFLMDHDIFIDCNQKTLEMFGCTREQIIGQSPYQFSPEVQPDGRKSTEKVLEKNNAAIKGQPQHFEWKHIRYDGTLFDAEISLNAFKDKGKYYIQAVCRDITERKKAEELLKESEAHYRLLADHIKDIVWLMDLNLKIKYVSSSMEKLLGYTLEEFIQLPLDKLLTATSLQTAMNFYSIEMPKALAAPPTYSLMRLLELEVRCKDGRTLWTENMFSFIRDENGKAVSILAEGRDITERKQIEYELRASESNFRRSLDDSPLGVRISTIEGETIYANRAILDMYGCDSLEEIKNMSVKERYTPDTYAEFQIRKAKRLRGEFGPSEYEISIVRKKGEIRHLHVFRKEIFWNGNKQFQVIYQDITDRKRAEEKLKEILESLRKAIKTTIQVLGTASETRDPYTAGHQKRVADLARIIATEMRLPHDTIEGIRMAGSIHDIGKLSIPAEILSKPAKLTNIEFSLIKEHPQIGSEMLKDVESPWPLAQIVYQHHERINGSGYPRNLKGNEILLEARIIAVADVVEAMASHRPYRPTLGIDSALEEIEKNKGILYDDTVADACLKLFREKGYQLT